MTGVPATLEATTASLEAADCAFDAIEAGTGATTLAGAIETGPEVGIDALAGNCTDVVYPLTAIGTIGPGDSVEPWTSAPEEMAPSIEATTGAGPVTVKMRVSMLAGGVMVTVAAACVTKIVVVVMEGVGRITLCTVPLTVKEWVVVCARTMVGTNAAMPKRDIEKNIVRCHWDDEI